MPKQNLSSVRRPSSDYVIVLVAHRDKNDGEESTRQGSPDGFQNPLFLAENNHRARKQLLKFIFSDIRMSHLVVRFSCSFVIGKGDAHTVTTCIYNNGALGERQVWHP